MQVTHHILVRLIVTSAHAELGVGVLVQQTLDDLALVGVSRSDLDVLLALRSGSECLSVRVA